VTQDQWGKLDRSVKTQRDSNRTVVKARHVQRTCEMLMSRLCLNQYTLLNKMFHHISVFGHQRWWIES